MLTWCFRWWINHSDKVCILCCDALRSSSFLDRTLSENPAMTAGKWIYWLKNWVGTSKPKNGKKWYPNRRTYWSIDKIFKGERYTATHHRTANGELSRLGLHSEQLGNNKTSAHSQNSTFQIPKCIPKFPWLSKSYFDWLVRYVDGREHLNKPIKLVWAFFQTSPNTGTRMWEWDWMKGKIEGEGDWNVECKQNM